MATKSVPVFFEGARLQCRPDATVAVALWEHGIRTLSHSPKYGRPRGLHCAAGICSSCLMRIDGIPNVPACQTPVRAGMRIERQDEGPPLRRPLQRALDMGGSLLPVGFYFKWFTRPAALSRFFLKKLRPMTGSGRLPQSDAGRAAPALQDEPAAAARGRPAAAGDLGAYDNVIVGAGLSGLLAARRISGRALLIDDQPGPGGQRWAALQAIRAEAGPAFGGLQTLRVAHDVLQEAIAALPGDRHQAFWQCRAVAGYHPDQLLLRDRFGLKIARSRSLIWTAGALDRIGLFTGNDLPGLFGPRAVYRLIARDGMDVRRRRVLVTGGGLDAWLAAALLHVKGARVALVLADSERPPQTPAAIDLGWEVHAGFDLLSIRPRSANRLTASFAARDDTRTPLDLTSDLAVIVQAGKPVYDIPYQLGADLLLDPARGGYVLRPSDGRRAVQQLPGGLHLEMAGEAAGLSADEVLVESSSEETIR